MKQSAAVQIGPNEFARYRDDEPCACGFRASAVSLVALDEARQAHIRWHGLTSRNSQLREEFRRVELEGDGHA